MRLQVFRLGAAAVLLSGALFAVAPLAHAQDQTALANAANAAMKSMANHLTAALNTTSQAAAGAEVRAAIAAGNQAVTALSELKSIATDDVVRSRSQAALDQTQNGTNEAQAASSQSGDAFRSHLQAAFAQVNEAIAEFIPVLGLVGPAPVVAGTQALPKSGDGDFTTANLAALGVSGLVLIATGAMMRRRAVARV